MNRYFKIYKPFNALSQFTPIENKKCLKDFFDVPSNVYPVGRLDYDSEGLLLLTDDKKINQLLLHPLNKHQREYWVQVEGVPTALQIEKLQSGVTININGKKYFTQKCESAILHTPKVPDRDPPIRFRKNVPDSWLRVILTEGKNRQVRKMTATVGLPTLRLIRHKIEDLSIEKMQPCELIELSKQDFYNLLRIKL